MNRSHSLLKALAFLLLLQVSVHAQTKHLGKEAQLPSHPRILLFKGEEEKIKKNIASDPIWSKTHQSLITSSNLLLAEAPVERIKIGRRLLDKSREALRRIFYLSYAYRTTGQQQYLQRAEKELLAIAAFSDWNPSHFLDVAEMTMAAAIGYDWLHDQLPAATKAAVKEAILKKGIEPSLDEKHNSWLRAEHNWNQVCNAGMTYGAMAIYEDHPDLAKKIIDRAITTIAIPMKDYAPSGAYPEGYNYWGYGTSFNVMFVSAVEKLYGDDFGLSKMPGFLQTAGYLEHMTGPTGIPFNYSDAGSKTGGLHPAMFWFASKAKDPSLLFVEKSYLAKVNPAAPSRDRLLPAIMIWGNGTSLNTIPTPQQTMWVGQGKVPVALMRTSWTDTNAVFVGFKGGSASVNHAHMDIGSFVMDADGVRWAMDFGMQEYESLESKGIQLFGRSQNAQRWTVFRLTNLVHNTLAVNNQHQLVSGHAPITTTTASPAFMSAVTDMSQVYNDGLGKAQRGIAIVDKSYVAVRDEIETLGNATTVRWTMLTPATVQITGANTAVLTQAGKKLTLQVQAPANVVMKTWSTDPPNSYDAPNPGTTLVGFEVTLPANTQSALNVLLVPEKAGKKQLKPVQPLQQWQAK